MLQVCCEAARGPYTLAAGAAVTLKAALSAVPTPPMELVACSVPATRAWLMERSTKLATPACSAIVLVPESVAVPPFASEMVMVPACPLVLLKASSAATEAPNCWPVRVSPGCATKASVVAAPPTYCTTSVSVSVPPLGPTTATNDLASATRDWSLVVKWPPASVRPETRVKVSPGSIAELWKVTGVLAMGWPVPSRAVTRRIAPLVLLATGGFGLAMASVSPLWFTSGGRVGMTGPLPVEVWVPPVLLASTL